jgi:hypothetical protein
MASASGPGEWCCTCSGRRNSEETLRRYRTALERFAQEAAGRARRAGLDYVLVPAVDGAADQVLGALAKTEALK